MLKIRVTQLICLIIISHYQYPVLASYTEWPSVFNSPPNGYAFATPLPCDSPLPPPLEATYAKPLLFASYPFNYAVAQPTNYAAPAAPTFVKYAPAAAPRIKTTNGLPVTTTFTTAVGFAAPAPAPVPNIGSPLGYPPVHFPATFGAPTASYDTGVGYAAPPHFLNSATYAAPSFLAATPLVRKFRAPLPVTGYSYAQGAPSAAW